MQLSPSEVKADPKCDEIITALARTADMLEDTNRLLKVIMDIHGDRLLDEAMLRDHYNANRSALGALYSLLERGGV